MKIGMRALRRRFWFCPWLLLLGYRLYNRLPQRPPRRNQS